MKCLESVKAKSLFELASKVYVAESTYDFGTGTRQHVIKLQPPRTLMGIELSMTEWRLGDKSYFVQVTEGDRLVLHMRWDDEDY